MPVPTPLERVGSVLSERYRLEQLIARGGMGVLYVGRHMLTGRRVAVKVMRHSDEPSSQFADRFLREARIAAAIEHPNVVQIFDMGVDDDSLFLVMELLEGESLAEYLGREATLTPALALEWLTPIMGALATAHDRGVIHRDVKPDNVFLARRGNRIVPTLLDFGVAKQSDAGTLTESGVSIGTPSYMSPEQARGELHVGPASDVWAMGVMLYHCLSGSLPFSSQTPMGMLVKIVSERPQALAARAPHVDGVLAHVIDKALTRDLNQRFPEMRAFARALVQAAQSRDIALPAQPDAIGLPDWGAWLSHPNTFDTTAASLPAATRSTTPPPHDDDSSEDEDAIALSGTRRSNPPPPRHTRFWLAFSLLLAAAASLAWWLPRSVEVAADANPASARTQPAVPAGTATSDGTLPGPVSKQARTQPASAPPAAAPEPSVEPDDRVDEEAAPSGTAVQRPRTRKRPSRRARRRHRAKASQPSRPPSIPSTPAPSDVEDVEADPFEIRRNYQAP